MSEARSALKIIRLPSFIYFGWKKNVEKKLPAKCLDVLNVKTLSLIQREFDDFVPRSDEQLVSLTRKKKRPPELVPATFVLSGTPQWTLRNFY
jgi:hypothetical protein